MSQAAIERGIRPNIEGIEPRIITPPPSRGRFSDPWKYLRLTLAAGVGLGLVACSPDAKATQVVNPEPKPAAAAPAETPTAEISLPTATAEAQKSLTPESEQQAQCSFFKDSQFCGLAEVYQGINPRTGQFRGVGIKSPNNYSTVIKIVSPIDGWFHPILDNPRRGNISTDKNSVVDGWVIDGVEFNPTGRADATPIKKGDVIGILRDTGYRPLAYAPDYVAYFGPRAADEGALIKKDFSTAATKPPRQVEFQSSGTKIEQGPVIIR